MRFPMNRFSDLGVDICGNDQNGMLQIAMDIGGRYPRPCVVPIYLDPYPLSSNRMTRIGALRVALKSSRLRLGQSAARFRRALRQFWPERELGTGLRHKAHGRMRVMKR